MSELRTDAPMDLMADEPQSENEDDWIDDSVADRTQGQHAGPSAATANEVCLQCRFESSIPNYSCRDPPGRVREPQAPQ